MATLLTEVETIALDQGDSKIPATIDVPKGSTTFIFDDDQDRIDQRGRDRGKPGVQVGKACRVQLELDEIEKMMVQSKYSTNKILEKTPARCAGLGAEREGAGPGRAPLPDDRGPKGQKWICELQPMAATPRSGWRQRDACATLKAK
ncbi:MAG: hypothetical protein U0168_25945 [Nannocystaceae bacterium]